MALEVMWLNIGTECLRRITPEITLTLSLTVRELFKIEGILKYHSGDDSLIQTWKSGVQATNDNAGCDALIPGSTYIEGSSSGGTEIRCQTTHLSHAIEIMGDHTGNENLLCESGETCLYTLNIGSYQGHGNIISAGTFVDGTLTNITLQKYETNGR